MSTIWTTIVSNLRSLLGTSPVSAPVKAPTANPKLDPTLPAVHPTRIAAMGACLAGAEWDRTLTAFIPEEVYQRWLSSAERAMGSRHEHKELAACPSNFNLLAVFGTVGWTISEVHDQDGARTGFNVVIMPYLNALQGTPEMSKELVDGKFCTLPPYTAWDFVLSQAQKYPAEYFQLVMDMANTKGAELGAVVTLSWGDVQLALKSSAQNVSSKILAGEGLMAACWSRGWNLNFKGDPGTAVHKTQIAIYRY